MKKVLSVAMASAMVLGMGANAFAISYSTGSNEKADWPDNFQFDGSLFVTDKDGKLIEESTTELNDNEAVNFEPGDVIWMPLYADDQVKYDYIYNEGDDELDAVTGVKVDVVDVQLSEKTYWKNGDKWYESNTNTNATKNLVGWLPAEEGTDIHFAKVDVKDIPTKVKYDDEDRKVAKNSERYYVGTTRYTNVDEFKKAAAMNGANAYVTVNLEGVDGTDDSASKPINSGKVVKYGHYTGNIDKNWSINLIEKSTGVAELIEKAELYKATVKERLRFLR